MPSTYLGDGEAKNIPLANDFFLGVVADGVLVRDWCLLDLVLSRPALWRGDAADAGDWYDIHL